MSQPTASEQKLGFRQKLRQTFRSKSPGATPHKDLSPPNAQPATQVDALVSVNKTIPASSLTYFERAVQRLSSDERETIQKYVGSGTSAATIDQALEAVRTKQKECADRRWSFSIAGRPIALQDKAEQVLEWLDRFKAVGDLAAGVDPIHIGLPWAGVKILLEATVANVNLMAALLVGSENVLYMTRRLQVYTMFSQQLPASSSKTNLEESIVIMYAHILRFLANALQAYEKSVLRRALTAFWRLDDIKEFEEKATEFARKIETDASNCDRDLAKDQLQATLHQVEKLRELRSSIEQLNINIDLGRIPYAKGAMFDSYDAVHTFCHPETRVDLLTDVQNWAQASDGKGIFWLTGAAGTGKSTISHTLAQWLSEKGDPDLDLGASFFFKRGEGDRGSAARVFPTIIRQLILKISKLGALISEVVQSDPFIFEKALGEQFRKLLLSPLQNVSSASTLIVVMDALDECDNDADIQTTLELWSQLISIPTIRLKLFLTSRPDQPIRMQFRQMAKNLFHNVVLQEAVPPKTIEHDLSIYLRDTFSNIRNQHNIDLPVSLSLDKHWPGEETLLQLVSIATPLFIVAATICRFVGDPNFEPAVRLSEILDSQSTGQLEQMEVTYLPVLRFLTVRGKRESAQLCDDFRVIVGSIICLAEPLSLNDLALLLKRSEVFMAKRLGPLHSVLRIPEDNHTPIRILHLSFAEFLMSETIKEHPFAINVPQTHVDLSRHCIRLLSEHLREDICEIGHPGMLRSNIDRATVLHYIPTPLEYSCQYWVYHLEHSARDLHDGDEVHVFLERHFLHWLEALSLIDRMSEALPFIQVLQDLSTGEQLSSLLADARRFVLTNRNIINKAPLQIYLSAYIFAPRDSLVRQNCATSPPFIKRFPVTSPQWGPELQRLEQYHQAIDVIAYSPDGKQIASGTFMPRSYYPDSGDGSDGGDEEHDNQDLPDSLQLWDTTTGQIKQSLKGHLKDITAIEFSPDGKLLVSASDDMTIRLWDPATGRELEVLNHHTSRIRALAVSLSTIASSSGDDILLFDILSSQWTRPLTGHTDDVTSLIFVTGGMDLISSSKSGCIILWDTVNQTIIRSFVEQRSDIRVVALSPDNSLLASGSTTGKIKLWSLDTGEELMATRDAGDDAIEGLSFSCDGRKLASTSFGGPIFLHDVSSHEIFCTLNVARVNDLKFSPNEPILASAAADGTIRLWNPDLASGEPQKPSIISGRLYAVFGYDGSILAIIGQENYVNIWSTAIGSVERKLEVKAGVLAFSHTSYILAVGGWYDEEITLWDAGSGRQLPFLASQVSAHSMAFSRDDRTLAISTWTDDLQLWDIETGELRQMVPDLETSEYVLWDDEDRAVLLRSAFVGIQDGIARVRDRKYGYVESYQRRTQHFHQRFVDDWLQYGNADFLWLPTEFRDTVAIHKDTIALTDELGQVLFIQFDLDKMTHFPKTTVQYEADFDDSISVIDEDNDDNNADTKDDEVQDNDKDNFKGDTNNLISGALSN